MILSLILFLIFLFILLKSAEYSIKHSSKLAGLLKLPEFVVSFFIIALISAIPETTISIISAIQGTPELGFGALLGSNIADLTIVFGIVALFSYNGIKIESKILTNNFSYLILLAFPLILGIDGRFSRIDGLILLILGSLFFLKIYRDSKKFHKQFKEKKKDSIPKHITLLIVSIIILLVSAFLTVEFATDFANKIKLSPLIIGATIIALGTCLPELVFAIKAIKQNKDDLAMGDILGNVITDTTIILGLVALISPFNYAINNIIFIAGSLFLAGILATIFMKTNKSINKIEGIFLILIYILFVFAQLFFKNFL